MPCYALRGAVKLSLFSPVVLLAIEAIKNIPTAKAGIVAWGMCVVACQQGLSVMIPGGAIIAYAAGGPACEVLCAPFLTPALP